MHRDLELKLRERVKELTCLYQVAKLTTRSDTSLEQILEDVVQLLPPAMLHESVAAATIRVDGQAFTGSRRGDSGPRLGSDVTVDGVPRGRVEVQYVDPTGSEAPLTFLPEEQHLLDAVAREVGQIVARHEAEAGRARLQRQLQHADRLATVGTLAAGVAHEINEPLGAILGFTQLALKSPGLPAQVDADLKKVVDSCLKAREIVRKLLIFSRQQPPRAVEVDLNRVVEDALSFLEGRIAGHDVRLAREFSSGLPEMVADPIQLNQVVVNLVVNSLQAMPDGGTLTVATGEEDGQLLLTVRDTGAGMDEETRQRVFLPFFTTKEEGQGTGLGLAVVHGIVASHAGNIRIASTPGRGTTVEVRLPRTGADDPGPSQS